MSDTFSDRHGYGRPEPEITVREGAPPELRTAILPLAEASGLRPYQVLIVVCHRLLTIPRNLPSAEYEYQDDPPEIIYEIANHLYKCDWPKIYDIAEDLYVYIRDVVLDGHHQFSDAINRLFRQEGIGWEMNNGKIQYRGSDAFSHATKETVAALRDSGRSQAAKEIKEALADISRRPEPDITGAVHHAMAALEATARDITGEPKSTLGELIRPLNLKPPLNKAIGKLWGYASNEARHGSEASSLDELEAELMVLVASSICTFLVKSHNRTR